MELQRSAGGQVLLAGVAIRRWFETNNVTPVQDRFRGRDGEGRPCMCLLTTLAYIELGGDAVALHARMDRIGYCRGDQPDPNYRRMDQILADVVGLSRRQSLDLESGWTESVVDRAVREARGESLELWDLGRDAWVAAKEAHTDGPGTEGGRS